LELNLRAIRIEKGLSVLALVKLSGVSSRTIQDIEKRGDCRPQGEPDPQRNFVY
jgi:predicted transcriptional regulator